MTGRPPQTPGIGCGWARSLRACGGRPRPFSNRTRGRSRRGACCSGASPRSLPRCGSGPPPGRTRSEGQRQGLVRRERAGIADSPQEKPEGGQRKRPCLEEPPDLELVHLDRCPKLDGPAHVAKARVRGAQLGLLTAAGGIRQPLVPKPLCGEKPRISTVPAVALTGTWTAHSWGSRSASGKAGRPPAATQRGDRGSSPPGARPKQLKHTR